MLSALAIVEIVDVEARTAPIATFDPCTTPIIMHTALLAQARPELYENTRDDLQDAMLFDGVLSGMLGLGLWWRKCTA